MQSVTAAPGPFQLRPANAPKAASDPSAEDQAGWADALAQADGETSDQASQTPPAEPVEEETDLLNDAEGAIAVAPNAPAADQTQAPLGAEFDIAQSVPKAPVDPSASAPNDAAAQTESPDMPAPLADVDTPLGTSTAPSAAQIAPPDEAGPSLAIKPSATPEALPETPITTTDQAGKTQQPGVDPAALAQAPSPAVTSQTAAAAPAVPAARPEEKTLPVDAAPKPPGAADVPAAEAPQPARALATLAELAVKDRSAKEMPAPAGVDAQTDLDPREIALTRATPQGAPTARDSAASSAPQITAPPPAVAFAQAAPDLQAQAQAAAANGMDPAPLPADPRGASVVQAPTTLPSTAQPVPTPAWPAVAQQIAEVARPLPDGPIQIRLHPEELGRLRLSFSAAEGGMTVTISAERGETLDMMRRNVQTLEDELRRFGFENLNFSFQDNPSEARRDLADATQLTLETPSDTPVAEAAVPQRGTGLSSIGIDIRI